MPHSNRITIRDVADAASLSPAAVSYALRGIMVSEGTQRRVQIIADQLGYKANPIGRALARGQTETIGILSPSLHDLWQQQLVAEGGRILLAQAHYALILDAGGDASRQRDLALQLRDQHVAGLIVSPIDPGDCSWSELTKSVPTVSIGDSVTNGTPVGEVLFDNHSGVRCAFDHLHALGHRTVAVVRPPGSPTNDRPAEVIVATEARRLGFTIHVANGAYELASATGVARELLQRHPRPTAVFCFADVFAHGVYNAARHLGLAIPRDLTVIGYDDQPVSNLLTPPLTTFSWDSTRVMQTAVDMLLAGIAGLPHPDRVVIRPTPQERGSAARACTPG